MVWRESYNSLPLQTPFQDNENFCVSYDSRNNIHYFIKPESQDWSVENWKTCPDDNCSGNGLCDPVTGLCVCYNGWRGLKCEYKPCPGGCSGKILYDT